MRARGMLLVVVAAVAVVGLAGRAAVPSAARCAASKLKAAGGYADATLRCHALAAGGGGTVDPACLAKAGTKLVAKFTAAEAKGGCGSVDDAAAVAAAVGAVGGGVVAAVTGDPPGALLTDAAARQWAAAKLRAVAPWAPMAWR